MEQPQFSQIFGEYLKGPLADLLDLKTEIRISTSLDQYPLQDSFRFKAKYLGLKIASLLIDHRGELHLEKLFELNRLLEDSNYLLGPDRESDGLIYEYLQKSLKLLEEKKEIWDAIRKFSPPLCHKKAEEIVRDTLWPETFRTLETAHVRRAVLASWLTLLRQSTGSCFATAPAILIQKNYPLQFFKDLYELLSTGQLKRTIGGKQYAVPLTLNTGNGDLQRIAPHLEAAFGVRSALEACEISLTADLLEKVKAQNPETPEKWLRFALLESFQLTEEDLKEEEQLSRIQIAPIVAAQLGVYYQKPSLRAQKIADWKKKLAAACKAFQSLTECPLLRSWEYTIASFCDVKTEFARWNLFIGLGLHPDQAGGVGNFLYTYINSHLQKCNEDVERLSREYEEEVRGIQALETMIRAASSEARRNQLKSEWTAHQLTAHSILEIRDRAIQQAESLSKFYLSLLEQYDQKLQEQFQEIFDPALSGEDVAFLEDGLAGFRLVYKHGRSDASQWTFIYNAEQYIDSLREFFSHVENDLDVPPELGKFFISELTTALLQFIQRPEFLNAALQRSREKGRKSPWHYISGGTLQSLLMAYCNRDRPFQEENCVPHSEEEVLQFLMEAKNRGPFLIHSPTHAFIFYPELLSGVEEIKKEAGQNWNGEHQDYLAACVTEKLPEEERALFIHRYRQKTRASNNAQFREQLVEALSERVKDKFTLIDSVLYEQTPVLSQEEAKKAFKEIGFVLGFNESTVHFNKPFVGFIDLYDKIKQFVLQNTKSPFSPIDWDLKIIRVADDLGIRRVCSFAFADTNWSLWFFGFVLNPATGHLELWRLNRTGTRGLPMTDWKEWLNSKNSASWCYLSNPTEYQF